MSDPERRKSNLADTDFKALGITGRESGTLPDRGVVFDPSEDPNSGATKTLSKTAPKRNPEDAKRLRNEYRLGYIEASKKAGTTEGDMGKVVNELVKKGEAIRLRKPKRSVEEIERTKRNVKSLYNAGFTYRNNFYNLGFTYDEISEILNEPYHIITNSMERLAADNAVTRRVRHGSSVSRERLQIDAKKIEEARVVNGISKNKLARELGVGKSHIRELIKGNIKTVKPAVMKRLEDMLGVEPGALQRKTTSSF